MREKPQKVVIFVFIGCAVLYLLASAFFTGRGGFAPSLHITGPVPAPESEQTYQASYALRGSDGPTALATTVFAQSDQEARELAAVSFENSAQQLGVTLPDGFENHIALHVEPARQTESARNDPQFSE